MDGEKKAMSANQASSVLARKLAAAREEGAQGGAGRSALRAFRLSLGRVAAELYDLQLAVIGATQSRSDADGLAGRLDGNWLILLMEGSAGRKAAVCLDRECVTALIQQQTMGQVGAAPVPDRPFTGTDAALVAPLTVAALQSASDLAGDPRDRACFEGYRFGAHSADLRSLLLALEADRFRLFCLTVEFADGAAQGMIRFIVPETSGDGASKTGAGDGKAGVETLTLGGNFAAMRAELTAVVGRVRLSLNDLAGLKPGETIPISPHGLHKTELVAIDGSVPVAGRLGQAGGMRAVRVNETRAPSGHAILPPEETFDDALEVTAHRRGDAQGDTAAPDDGSSDPARLAAPPVFDTPADDPAGGADDGLLNLNPRDAAVEISELAGLSLHEVEIAMLPDAEKE